MISKRYFGTILVLLTKSIDKRYGLMNIKYLNNVKISSNKKIVKREKRRTLIKIHAYLNHNQDDE